MADDKKTLKFQMMMSPAEADELDDWMFRKRIRSRAEAIRRLCQLGLSVEKQLARFDDILNHAEHLSDDETQRLLDAAKDQITDKVAATAIFKLRAFYAEFETRMILEYGLLLHEHTAVLAGKNVEEALARANDLKKQTEGIDTATYEGRAKLLRIMRSVRLASQQNEQ